MLPGSVAEFLTPGQRKETGGATAPAGDEFVLSWRLRLAAGLLEIVDDGGVGQRRCVAEVVLALGHAAKDAAHYLAAPRLRQVGGEDYFLRPGVRAYGLPDLVVELLDELFGSLSVAFQDHVGHNSLALVFVEPPDNGGLGYVRVRDERALDLHRADAVSGDVHHVVYPARDGVVTVFISLGAILDEILVVRSMPGHGLVTTRFPFPAPSIGLSSSS
jgi:hypothetical protein